MQTPFDLLVRAQEYAALFEAMEALPRRYAKILIDRFAMNGGEPVAAREIATQQGVGVGRIHYIERIALGRLWHNVKLRQIVNEPPWPK